MDKNHEARVVGWESFGLTVTPQPHTVWFDQPASDHTWQLVAR